MKNLKLLVVAFVAMLGFAACDNKPEHIYDDHSADIVGTWSCFTENYAEVIIISADGTAVSYGVEDGEYWENIKGTVSVKENNITMIFEDDDNFTGHFDIIPGQAFSLFEDSGERYIYQYCANDLADEIVGMWVCNDGTAREENGIVIHTYTESGKTYLTTATSAGTGYFAVNEESEYKVIGDLMFLKLMHKTLDSGVHAYAATKLTYTPNATSVGDIMTLHCYMSTADGFIEEVNSFLRVKQSLDLTGTTYDYSSAYVSNAKGKDEDFSMLGHTFNMANIKGHNLDMMFRSELFSVDLNAKSITQRFRANGRDIEIVIPITVDDNKVTLDLSAENPAYRKVDMYMFQDADNSQLHMYMHTNDFINYFANMELYNLLASGEIDKTDAAAIEKVYTDMEARIESINVSFIFKARK